MSEEEQLRLYAALARKRIIQRKLARLTRQIRRLELAQTLAKREKRDDP